MGGMGVGRGLMGGEIGLGMCEYDRCAITASCSLDNRIEKKRKRKQPMPEEKRI
jgi:hypothetical protein